ncbi:MAG: DUF1059 domain-containing protein [Gemmatimonadota bacterium]|jgi:predicted small metal-binding protein
MAKELRCGDLMPGCDYVARAESENEVLAKAAVHARDAHGLAELDEATAAKVKAAIRDA